MPAVCRMNPSSSSSVSLSDEPPRSKSRKEPSLNNCMYRAIIELAAFHSRCINLDGFCSANGKFFLLAWLLSAIGPRADPFQITNRVCNTFWPSSNRSSLNVFDQLTSSERAIGLHVPIFPTLRGGIVPYCTPSLPGL